MNGLCDFCRQRRKRNFFGLCKDCNIELGNIQSRKELEEAIELQRQTMESDDLSAARTGR